MIEQSHFSQSFQYSPASLRWEYHVEVVMEGALGAFFLGESKVKPSTLIKVMNRCGADGWELKTMVVEQRRMLLLWNRDAVIMSFARPYYVEAS